MSNPASNYPQEIGLISKRGIRFDICGLCDHTLSPPFKFLSCGRSFCAMCIQEYHSKQFQKHSIVCKVCDRKSTLPEDEIDGLPVNFAFHKLLEIMKNPTDDMSTSLSCSPCSFNVDFASNELSSTQSITTSFRLLSIPLSLPNFLEVVEDETGVYQHRRNRFRNETDNLCTLWLSVPSDFSTLSTSSWPTNDKAITPLGFALSNERFSLENGTEYASYYAFKQQIMNDDDTLIDLNLFSR